jgi:hypothetical protein
MTSLDYCLHFFLFLSFASRAPQAKYAQYSDEASQWYKRAELALSKGEEDLAREALKRKKTAEDVAQVRRGFVCEMFPALLPRGGSLRAPKQSSKTLLNHLLFFFSSISFSF